MALDTSFVPWLCWIFPMAGSVFPLIIRRGSAMAKGIPVVLASLLSLAMAVLMLPQLSGHGYTDLQAFWFSIPGGGAVGMGMLLDPLSIIIANIVALLCFIIMVYSLKYVEGDPAAGRYWFLMSLFVGSMLLLVLADNLILFFVGWKMVGLCSYALIGHYYGDEREHWIGGPAPFRFLKPSRAGLKALLVTTFGDVALLASVIILYIYAGTFNFMELYQTAGVWLAEMGGTPGLLALTAVLLVAGPLAKSAQFPFQEWLPDAMAGPTPVSALIHAATMVKAGVYFVARVLPIFFFAQWIAAPGYPEAMAFFAVVATAGGITLFLGGSQAMVSLELKKALAYSTISAIGFMMLSLGMAGFTPGSLVLGVTSGIFHLITHGIYKAGLFLCAGVAIHASGSIYINEMGLSRRGMRVTWLAMWIGGLASVGLPPLSGFWSKEGILLSTLESGQIAFFAIASATAVITAFYVVRYMGLIFNGSGGGRGSETLRGGGALLLVPCAILAALTVLVGVIGPWAGAFLNGTVGAYFGETLGLAEAHGANYFTVDPVLLSYSMTLLAVGGGLGYWLYISRRANAAEVVGKHPVLKGLHRFLWERWYIDPLLNRVFVDWTLAVRGFIDRGVEGFMDRALNVGVPAAFGAASRQLRKIQTGVLSVNMLYFLLFVVALVLVLLLLGVP